MVALPPLYQAASSEPQKCSVKSRVRCASNWNNGSVFSVCPT